jgi:hypothetical protein
LQQRFAIAPLQLPQTSFFNEPQRHRGHREREIAPLNLPNSDSYGALRYRTLQPPKQRFLRSASLSHPLNSPISFFNEPQRHRGHRERAIAPPHSPKQRSHPLNSPNSDSYGAQRLRTPSNFPTSFFNEPQRHEEHEGTGKERVILEKFGKY